MAHDAVDNHELPDKKPWMPTGEIKMTTIELPKVIKNPQLHACVRGLALHLTQVEYCNIGYFFKSLSNSDIEYLLHRFNISENESKEDREVVMSATQEMILLTLLLGKAEGQTDISPDYLQEAMPNLGTLLTVEEMVRDKKLVVNYKNYSLTDTKKPVILGKTMLELKTMFNGDKRE